MRHVFFHSRLDEGLVGVFGKSCESRFRWNTTREGLEGHQVDGIQPVRVLSTTSGNGLYVVQQEAFAQEVREAGADTTC